MQRVPITKEGYDALETELNHLKNVERGRISKAIGEAREHGDLSENAEYHAAKEQQGLTEARINLLENQLSLAEVIDVSSLPKSEKIIFGATVSVTNLDTDNSETLQIVGEPEADITHKKISVTSPMARALIGKMVGDIAEVKAPSGIIEYEIDKIEYL